MDCFPDLYSFADNNNNGDGSFFNNNNHKVLNIFQSNNHIIFDKVFNSNDNDHNIFNDNNPSIFNNNNYSIFNNNDHKNLSNVNSHSINSVPFSRQSSSNSLFNGQSLPEVYAPSERNRSQRQVTEKVSVKSCAHVSYIVGKQGKKIREIRKQTETYIETPVNGEEPIFSIRGLPANVADAREMIQKSSQEFDQSLYLETQETVTEPGKYRYNLFLPAKFIGLVVGRQGYCVKKIMDTCGVEIVTPKINTLNLFKMIGAPGNVHAAITDIKKHIEVSTRTEIAVFQRNDREYVIVVI